MATKCEALIFGASGVSGWPLMHQCLAYPSPSTFASVTGLTNRPLSREIAQLPDDPRLHIYSGIDLSKINQLEGKLKDVEGIDRVTHVYFAAYTGHGSGFQELKRANVEILKNALEVVEKLCPKLEFWTLQTGGKSRIPQPWADNIFYYPQYDLIEEASRGKQWTFCEIRPDAIIGFVPQNNAMNMAQALGLFLSMYASVEGTGALVAFPGSPAAYNAAHTDTSANLLARFHIFSSLHSDQVSKRAFNVADGPAVKWVTIWPRICDYFHLKGVGPDEGPDKPTGAQWMEQKRSHWDEWVDENSLKPGPLEGTTWEFMSAVIDIPFDRQYDLSTIREVGFTETMDHAEGYLMAFDRMRKAKIIP